ncbi:D-glycerate dehydrogenase [Candidatus Woesebacteria bacterium RIFOXYC1_FULL_31_51]|uniref:D-isomer specific 2-hydroxyacid dehydrogenase NAD-binding protein n=1 Tax=Candidatus Woesebacteria bacterium GW2011_GWC2_31_9 TaxID=1618586 RepID=A0A0G0BKY9_9BACT|nr:MAG: D-isomer specific 2-hydroxyacid dehydrogenase NAD-binding protein [Candidatus Woesebacteria bacterium GW2011_GWF1_31_35]KKP23147.1 MAG: D-isomer specific 2-hydroxyacid dehydrogenase NAD-binding protein [Candidatus Woesebacteria bacterium GW2011_GWC1_30_29]KKP26835.1 MAG: D-isomer specific 2-hydroxyacid dehydrogenase NAD-binding protein [Candidatus Woesebacteria bacterium GW2011_GWD1_31_12]KKP27410.1 MAG: D-isomer specific 2-hydroxyacid dehydrogenase NAD-binding protein [Candidatus Woeseb
MKVFVTRKIPGESLEELKKNNFEVTVSEFDRPLTSEELLEKSKGVDALLCLLTDKIDGDLMDAIGPQLKIISNYAVGFDNINIADATDRGIVVTNTSCVEVDEAVAEHTWALIASLTRRIVEADETTRRGAFKGWEPNIFLGVSLIGKTLGIIGLGGIGTMVARRAIGYKMNVIYNKRKRDEEAEKNLGVRYSDLDTLFKESDVVTLHVPLTDETRHMINKETLNKMKKGSFLVNTARGPIVDEHSLVESLKDGHLTGAALDVFDNEPNIDPELIGMPNVITTPHIASATHEAREAMGKLAVSAILETFSSKEPINIVNKEVWEKRRK